MSRMKSSLNRNAGKSSFKGKPTTKRSGGFKPGRSKLSSPKSGFDPSKLDRRNPDPGFDSSKRTRRTDVGRKRERSQAPSPALSRGLQADADRYEALKQDIAEKWMQSQRGSTVRGRAAESKRLDMQAGGRGRPAMGAASVNPRMMDNWKPSARKDAPMGAASVNPRMMDAMAQMMQASPSQVTDRAFRSTSNPFQNQRVERQRMPDPSQVMDRAFRSTSNPFQSQRVERQLPPRLAADGARYDRAQRPMPGPGAARDLQRQQMEAYINQHMGRRFQNPFQR